MGKIGVTSANKTAFSIDAGCVVYSARIASTLVNFFLTKFSIKSFWTVASELVSTVDANSRIFARI